MRILMYGFSSRTISAKRQPRQLRVVTLLRAAFESMGHEVTVGYPKEGLSAEQVRSFDRVIIGMGAPNAIFSDRTYGALYMVGVTRGTDKLRLYFDEPHIKRIFYGFAQWSRKADPQNIFRTGYSKRHLWYDRTLQPDDAYKWAGWNSNQCTYLLGATDEPYPPVLLPVFNYADPRWVQAPLPEPAKRRLVTLDPSAMLSLRVENLPPVRDPSWVSESLLRSDSKWLRLQHVRFPVTTLRQRCTDDERIEAYQKVWGILDEPVLANAGGWWNHRMPLALTYGALYMTNPDLMDGLGEPFNLLASATEDLGQDERDNLAKQQYEAFYDTVPSHKQIREVLEEYLA